LILLFLIITYPKKKKVNTITLIGKKNHSFPPHTLSLVSSPPTSKQSLVPSPNPLHRWFRLPTLDRLGFKKKWVGSGYTYKLLSAKANGVEGASNKAFQQQRKEAQA
jgi:hypothetical protein